MAGLDIPKLLRKTRVGELEPRLQEEIVQLASNLGYERTIASNSNLSFLFDIYQAEKVKKNRGNAQLKKAEKMIMRLATLKHDSLKAQLQPEERTRQEDRRPFGAIMTGLPIMLSDRLKKIFTSIGITDERIMEKAVETIGEKKAEERVELILSSTLDEDTIKGIFRFHPLLIIELPEEKFVASIESMETKKDILDAWKKANGRTPPLDYVLDPEVLLTDLSMFSQLLGKKTEEPKVQKETEEKNVKYRAKPMDPRDLVKVLVKGLGCTVREGDHYVVTYPKTGKTTAISKSHQAQTQISRPAMKNLFRQLGIDEDEFEKKRQELGL